MVMHPHTKYNWPIWKDKKVMVWTSFAEKKQKKKTDYNNISLRSIFMSSSREWFYFCICQC
jgi:hypothetical protein